MSMVKPKEVGRYKTQCTFFLHTDTMQELEELRVRMDHPTRNAILTECVKEYIQNHKASKTN